jgi:hypothetical protein
MTLPKSTRDWLRALLAHFITGGATAVTAGAGIALADSVGVPIAALDLKQLIAVFLASGFFGAMSYLKQSPLPPLEGEKSEV